MAHHHLVAVGVAIAAFLAAVEASGIGFNLHHRSSPVVRQWSEARGFPLAGMQWPAHGSPEYYSELSRHDRALHARRGLAGAEGDQVVTFAAGNETNRLDNLGFLYYVEVSVGTPNASFMVALDTGSDLFWVPCDCKQCAPLDTNGTGLRPYSPRESTTSKQVTCDHDLCDRPNACSAATNGSCPYNVQYVSANTSSSGVLVEDVLHLTREQGTRGSAVQAPIVFGCGQVQTGAFLRGGSPDGLLGLGMDKVSVPSVLASKGLIASDSFSMCFSRDGVGRINFGDTGSPGQAETPFIVRSFHPTYNVSFTSVNVGGESTPVEFTAVIDSGTSFTYLNEPEYSAIATNFNSQVRERRANFSAGSIPFEYCYGFSRGQTELQLPTVSLTTQGRAVFPVMRPVVTLATQVNGQIRPLGYCLAILRNDISVNIIGQNFMTGLKVVFNREKSVLGWQEFDCYKDTRAAGGPDGSPQAAPAPTTNGNNGTNRYPGAVPVPQSANSGHKLIRRGLFLLLLLPLLVLAALV